MKNNYLAVGACLFLSLILTGFMHAQSTGPQFQDCSSSPISLCISDESVRLPLNNKIYLGEEDPEATSCSVHLAQKTKVKSTCGRILLYEVQLFLVDDTSTAIILQPVTTIATDSVFEAELTFDSELSPDSLISKNGIPYTAGCNSYHRIKWIVTDSCGESAICVNRINLFDCSKPTLNDTNILYVIRGNNVGQVYLQLDSILKFPKDDCAYEGEFLYSLYQDHFKQDSSFHICDVPAWGVELPYNVWIADKGKDVNCDGNIGWNERNIELQVVLFVFVDIGSTDCNGDPFLFGQVLTEDKKAVEKVNVTLSPQGSFDHTFITGKDGQFNFVYNTIPTEYTLSAERNDFHKNGVSTLDLVRIQKHLLGIEYLSSPYDVIAADANNSQNVSAIDLVEIRKLVLGIYTELPSNKSWRFVPKTFVFSDTIHPWPTMGSITFNSNNIPDLDFVGIKIGDVNNTVQANAQTLASRTSPQTLIWSTNQNKYSSNDFIDINFYVESPEKIQGFQFTLSDGDLEFLDITSGRMNMSKENFALFGDKMTLSWFNEEGFKTTQGEVLFTIKARAKRKGDLHRSLTINSDITEAEMYGMNDEVFIPILNTSQSIHYNGLIVYTPEPNPWREKTSIPFYISKAGSITLEIFDLNGRCVYTTKGTYGAGKNEITLSSSGFTPRGLMYFSLKTDNSSSIYKMIVLD
ncbi:MAG TPA: T9SS type A sorting domain-containing protein [Saprospiraceae bacterium]|nr:T9SS type A sorting domain-containing protein [Saprospiraceae bacterium]